MIAVQPLTTITALPLRRPRRESQKAREYRLWNLRQEFRERKTDENPNLTMDEALEMSFRYIEALKTLEDLHPAFDNLIWPTFDTFIWPTLGPP